MKRTLLTALSAALLIGSNLAIAQSDDSPAAREAAVNRYMSAVPTSKMMEDTYAEMSKQLPPEQRAWFVSSMRRVAKVETIERLAKASMIKHFTADELNALADFYSSKHGASAMAKFGVYMADVMPPLMQEMQRAAQEIQAEQKR